MKFEMRASISDIKLMTNLRAYTNALFPKQFPTIKRKMLSEKRKRGGTGGSWAKYDKSEKSPATWKIYVRSSKPQAITTRLSCHFAYDNGRFGMGQEWQQLWPASSKVHYKRQEGDGQALEEIEHGQADRKRKSLCSSNSGCNYPLEKFHKMLRWCCVYHF